MIYSLIHFPENNATLFFRRLNKTRLCMQAHIVLIPSSDDGASLASS